MSDRGELRRRLGVGDAVVVGGGSMIGAGVFAAWGPAAEAAGTGLLIGLAVAGLIAFCNATSSAQLAAVHPESGGTYVYARHRLGPAWGHLAGWGFVVGKIASCIAMAPTVGTHLWPDQAKAVGVAAVLGIVGVNLGGLSRTVAVTRVLLVVSLCALPELTVASVVIVLIMVFDLRNAIGLSGVAVLTYYALTNASALRMPAAERRWTPALAVVGLIGCLVLVVALPWESVLTGIATMAVGVAMRLATGRRTGSETPPG